MSTLEHIEVLLLVAAVVAMLVRRIRLPYTVGLLAVGVALAAVTGGDVGLELSADLVFMAFLPPLIFEAAFFIPWDELKRDLKPVVTLATVGVMISAAVTAAGMRWLGGWEWAPALVFGATVCATDPVSVIATFKEAGIHGRLRLLTEAESIINDGAAAVLFGVVAAIATGAPTGPASIALDLVREIGGGLLIGAATGYAVLWLAGKADDHLVEITFTTVAAYGSFVIAQRLHTSGVLSTLVCGLILGNIGPLGAISDKGREAVTSFWEFAAFVVNSLVFLLIGARTANMALHTVALPTALAFVVSTASRATAVYPLVALFRRGPRAIERRHQHILVWGGLRGALALALALGLPENLPHRDEVQAVAFGVVGLSILIQGITMTPLLKRLRLLDAPP